MKLVKTCIEQPVLAIVLSLVLIVIGIVGFLRLDIRYMPELKIPVITVRTTYTGASASLMESKVTTMLENSFADIDGVDYMTSSSSIGSSSITIQFVLGGNFDEEVNQIRDKISAVRANPEWPADADPPALTIGSQGSDLLLITFLDAKKSSSEIRDYLTGNIVPELQQVPGVGGVGTYGGGGYAMRIWLNPAEMMSYGITVTDVENRLTANNIDFSAGSIQAPLRNYSIISKTQLSNANQFANIILKQSPQGTVRIKDIAKVEFGSGSLFLAPLKINGKEGVMLAVKPVQGQNPINIAGAVKKELSQLSTTLPAGMKMHVAYDQSTFLKKSINETFTTIGEAVVLVILVVFLFLGSARATLIPVVTIPVSLIGVFSVVYFLGFSINVMSLLAIVLAIGLVVDDAIVMLENIHRHIEEGAKPMDAALNGSNEIATAVIAMGLTLAAVYAPIGLMQGFTAKLFQQFAFTLAGAVLISAFVALTLSPMMCARILQSKVKDDPLSTIVDKVFLRVSSAYKKILLRALSWRLGVIGILVVVGAIGYLLFLSLSSELLPAEDGGIFVANLISPANANTRYTNKYTDIVSGILSKAPGVSDVISQGGGGSSNFFVLLKPWQKRKYTPQQLITMVNPKLGKVPGVIAGAAEMPIIDYGEQGPDVTFNVMTNANYDDLLGPINRLKALFSQYPGFTQVNTNLKFDTQQYDVSVNRDLAANLGISIQDIADTMNVMMSGKHVTDVESGSRSYGVKLQMDLQDLSDFAVLNKLYVKSTLGSNAGQMIPLSSIVKLSPMVGQGTLSHFDRMRSGTVSANLLPGYTASDAIKYIDKVEPGAIKGNLRTAFSGKMQQFIESQGSIAALMIMSLVFIYLVLSAQFSSFIDPIIILVAVPLSMVGALLALKLVGGTLNLYSEIGVVTLVGLVSKHGILITKFVNQLREKGMPMGEAIVEGAMIRLRPILMTTAAMVFGTLPLALATGPGSVGRHQIGWVVIGGLLVGTFFSLVVVPIAYSYLGKFKQR